MITIFKTLYNGFKNVFQFKRYVILAYCLNFMLALVFAVILASIIDDSIGQSMAGENLRNGFDELWYPSFSADAKGIAATFHPSVVGIGAVFNGLENTIDGSLLENNSLFVVLGLLYTILWTYLSAGFISIYNKPEELPSFFQSTAIFFPRFLALTAFAGIIYYLLFQFVMNWLTIAVTELTRETIDERIHFIFVFCKYLFVWFLIWTVNLIFDYSKILIISQNVKNVLLAPLKAMQLVFSNFGKTYGLYLSIGIIWLIFMFIYWLIAPGAGQSSWVMIFGAFVISQIYIGLRIAIRCLFYAGQIRIFEKIIKS